MGWLAGLLIVSHTVLIILWKAETAQRRLARAEAAELRAMIEQVREGLG